MQGKIFELKFFSGEALSLHSRTSSLRSPHWRIDELSENCRRIDGMDLSSAIIEDSTEDREEFLTFSGDGLLEGIRQGEWKLLLKKDGPLLFHITEDLAETKMPLDRRHNAKIDYPALRGILVKLG